MNIFILDKSLSKSAQLLCDQHLNKQILELAQIICTVLEGKDNIPYKSTHRNHPVTKWAYKNLIFCESYLIILNNEYKHRTNKDHMSYLKYFNQGYKPVVPLITIFTGEFPIRNNLDLIKEKLKDWKIRTNKRKIIAKWTNRNTPDWYLNDK